MQDMHIAFCLISRYIRVPIYIHTQCAVSVWLRYSFIAARKSCPIFFFPPFRPWTSISYTSVFSDQCSRLKNSSSTNTILTLNPQLDYKKIASMYGRGMHHQPSPLLNNPIPIPFLTHIDILPCRSNIRLDRRPLPYHQTGRRGLESRSRLRRPSLRHHHAQETEIDPEKRQDDRRPRR